jgi:zinc-ribbon domain
MYCSICGKQLPDDANFCSNCGKAVKEDVKQIEKVSEPRWESCEIMCQDTLKPASFFTSHATVRFSVEAIGKNGKYEAGYSEGFQISRDEYFSGTRTGRFIPHPNDPNVVAALDMLISKLTKEGWESTGRGQTWFNHKFRRQVK